MKDSRCRIRCKERIKNGRGEKSYLMFQKKNGFFFVQTIKHLQGITLQIECWRNGRKSYNKKYEIEHCLRYGASLILISKTDKN